MKGARFLQARDGRLQLIELVDNSGQGMLSELPEPRELDEPIVLGPTAARSWWQDPRDEYGPRAPIDPA